MDPRFTYRSHWEPIRAFLQSQGLFDCRLLTHSTSAGRDWCEFVATTPMGMGFIAMGDGGFDDMYATVINETMGSLYGPPTPNSLHTAPEIGGSWQARGQTVVRVSNPASTTGPSPNCDAGTLCWYVWHVAPQWADEESKRQLRATSTFHRVALTLAYLRRKHSGVGKRYGEYPEGLVRIED